MAYKAPLPMRLFHYALWTTMLFVVAWFFLIPIFLRFTAPQPTGAPNQTVENSSTSTPAESLVPVQEPAPPLVTP